ncbi:hypothetical protein NDU88_003126 [Pleurodeles waltl]|uniref:Uncharacterized protein n=1 Tax=Pleurodeles waltl TaxID=8319 RepID=A0AAV7V0G3_PLEWA|nr:hypothetical protein NDU88_003126 [Pleurodeles waltl]
MARGVRPPAPPHLQPAQVEEQQQTAAGREQRQVALFGLHVSGSAARGRAAGLLLLARGPPRSARRRHLPAAAGGPWRCSGSRFPSRSWGLQRMGAAALALPPGAVSHAAPGGGWTREVRAPGAAARSPASLFPSGSPIWLLCGSRGWGGSPVGAQRGGVAPLPGSRELLSRLCCPLRLLLSRIPFPAQTRRDP